MTDEGIRRTRFPSQIKQQSRGERWDETDDDLNTSEKCSIIALLPSHFNEDNGLGDRSSLDAAGASVRSTTWPTC